MKMKAQHTQTYGTLKAVLRGKFIALSSYIKKSGKISHYDLTAQLKALQQKEADSPWSSQEEIIKLRAEINKTETKKTIQKNQTKMKQRNESLRKSTNYTNPYAI